MTMCFFRKDGRVRLVLSLYRWLKEKKTQQRYSPLSAHACPSLVLHNLRDRHSPQAYQ